jgi:hypothetical protein
VLLNAETARLGAALHIEGYRTRASAIGDWWITRRQRAPSSRLLVPASTQPSQVARREEC